MNWKERLDAMASAYQDSAILLAAIRHRIFDELGPEPRPAGEVAAARGLDPRATAVVLNALVAAEVLVKVGEGFVLPDDRAAVLRSDGADTQVSIFGHHHHLMSKWIRLDEVLADGRPVERRKRSESELRDFICGMRDVQRRSLQGVLEVVDFSDAASLLDLGGGPATAALTFAERWPQLRCTVFDLPEPCAIARERIEAAGLGDRVEVMPGDYHVDGLGSGYDVVYISNIIHSLGDAETARIFAKCRDALAPGGRLLVKDFYLDDTGAAPAFPARFSVNMLVASEGGKSYTESETRALMTAAGFSDIERLEVPVHSAILAGVRRG